MFDFHQPFIFERKLILDEQTGQLKQPWWWPFSFNAPEAWNHRSHHTTKLG
jgi:hypothetical protein